MHDLNSYMMLKDHDIGPSIVGGGGNCFGAKASLQIGLNPPNCEDLFAKL
jgi:hypothetical protein